MPKQAATIALAPSAPAGLAVAAPGRSTAEQTTLAILIALSVSHLMNDTMQSVIQALYPMFRATYHLDYGQVGLITLAFQMTASILQPLVGLYADKRPMPYSLAVGMGSTFIGLVLLSRADSFASILVAAAMVGIGSSVFHPESSRVARMASGGRYGFAQALFQVGGNTGSALGPLLAAFVVVPQGQRSVAWVSGIALIGIVVLFNVGRWYTRNLHLARPRPRRVEAGGVALSRSRVAWSITILIALMFSKFVYLSSLSTYFTFYLIHKFGVSVQHAQIFLFVFLASGAVGTFLGGPIGDRIGRKYLIWGSIAGVLPFTLALPHVGLIATLILVVPIGLILSSAFSAIVVYAQELVPGKVGMIAGLFFGFAFGLGGLGAAGLGALADATSIETVYMVCSVLPAIGLLTALLPDLNERRDRDAKRRAAGAVS
jgi:FSR family fosmidomycin resistance protein-like MFS transporter